jgi:hypothetical protein
MRARSTPCHVSRTRETEWRTNVRRQKKCGCCSDLAHGEARRRALWKRNAGHESSRTTRAVKPVPKLDSARESRCRAGDDCDGCLSPLMRSPGEQRRARHREVEDATQRVSSAKAP